MATNEQRARLCGWTCRMIPVMHGGFAEADGPVFPEPYWFAPDNLRQKLPPHYDTSRDACAELLEYVRARKLNGRFINELRKQIIGDEGHVTVWMILCATPQQICAAFDATFEKELEGKQ